MATSRPPLPAAEDADTNDDGPPTPSASTGRAAPAPQTPAPDAHGPPRARPPVDGSPEGHHVARGFLAAATARPEDPALGERGPDGRWRSTTFAEAAATVRRLTNALVQERLLPSETAVVMAPASPRWVMAHLAVLAAGGVSVPVDEAIGDEDTVTIVRETEARVVLVEGERARATVERIRSRLPGLRLVITLDDPAAAATGGSGGLPGRSEHDGLVQLPLSQIERLPYDLATAAEARRRAEEWAPADVAAVHYVPTATGRLRGVVHTHDSTMYPVRWAASLFTGPTPPSYVSSVQITQSVGYWSVLSILLNGGCVWFLPAEASYARALRELRPTVVVTDLETVEDCLRSARKAVTSRPTVSPDRVERALEVSARVQQLRAEHRPVPAALAVSARAAEVAVIAPMRALLGGAKLLTLVGGQAVMPPEVVTTLDALGQAPAAGWGTLEVGGLATFRAPTSPRSGSAGTPLPGTSLRLDDDGTVLVRGPGTMLGYYGRPDDTRETLVGGWLRSRQPGRLDDDGQLYLTSRLDDVIVTSSLRSISARPLERALEDSPLVAEAVVVGDARPVLAVLVRPDLTAVRRVLEAESGSPAQATDVAGTPDEELVCRPRVVRLVGDVVRRCSEGEPPERRLAAFRLVLDELGASAAVTGAAMTRRQRAMQDHAAVIDAMYADLEPSRRRAHGA